MKTRGGAIGFTFEQVSVTNAMIDQAIRQYGADFVMPLDADEYPCLVGSQVEGGTRKRFLDRLLPARSKASQGPRSGSVRSCLEELAPDCCYCAYWMPFAPPRQKLDNTRFAPLSFTRRKKQTLSQWPKMLLPAKIWLENELQVTKGSHGLVSPSGNALPQVVCLSPKLVYAHYMFRGTDHFLAKTSLGWLANYTQDNWQRGMSEHYLIACEEILRKNGNLDRDFLEWFALSCGGMTGESREETLRSIEDIDPTELFPDIPLRYTARFSVGKGPFVLLLEQSMALADRYRKQRGLS